MNIQARKLQLIEELVKLEDIDVLEQVKQLLLQKNNPVVGYGANGDVITRQQLIHRLREAEERIDKGEFTTQENLEKEAENW